MKHQTLTWIAPILDWRNALKQPNLQSKHMASGEVAPVPEKQFMQFGTLIAATLNEIANAKNSVAILQPWSGGSVPACNSPVVETPRSNILLNTLRSLVTPQQQLMRLVVRIAVLLNGISNG